MKIDNGAWCHLVIEGVFDGRAGLSRGVVAFRPNCFTEKPEMSRGGTLNGEPILIAPYFDKASGYWLTRIERP